MTLRNIAVIGLILALPAVAQAQTPEKLDFAGLNRKNSRA